jgi:hypothetical protein
MTESSAAGTEPQLGKRTGFGGIPFLSAQTAGKGWNFIPLAPGLFGGFLAYNLYPLLDGHLWLVLVPFLCCFLVAVFPRSNVYAGLALALVAAVVFFNGALDRFPPTEVRTTVIRKASVTGAQKYGTHYHVIVASWRPGRSQEDFDVDLSVFRRAVPGRTVTIELHKGFYRLPWYGSISPE